MDGLLPMVYKAIKRRRTRQKYECLSSGVAQMSEDYYMMNVNMNMNMNMMRTTSTSSCSMSQTRNTKAHRRHKSVGEYAFGMSRPEIHSRIRDDDVGNKKAQPVRFRSHNFRMFSCVGSS